MASYKIIVQSIDPKKWTTFEYQLCKDDKSDNYNEKVVLPFPPYKTSRNFEIFSGLASITAPLISDKKFADIKDSPILRWIYSYKINYPHKPNFFDLMLAIGTDPDRLENRDPAAVRYTIHQFLKIFGEQAQIAIKEYSLAIPKNNTVFRKVDDDVIAFIPTLTPIAPFTINPISSEKKADDDQGFVTFPFPTTLSLAAYNNKESETNGPAFTNDNLDANTNVNTNTNTNANISINAINKDQEKTTNFNFYGGLFESSDKPMRYVLVKVNGKYYKHELFTYFDSPINEVIVIDPTDRSIINDKDKFNPRDSCIAAFFIKENGKVKPKIYQKI